MNKIAYTIQTKLNSTYLIPSKIPFSEYQQSAEIKELWTILQSSIISLLKTMTSAFTMDPIDTKSQLISVSCASTLLSTTIDAIISTQKRMSKSNKQMEEQIKTQVSAILNHVQILEQSSPPKKKLNTQKSITNHIDILVDLLISYSQRPLKRHDHEALSFYRRYSQPAVMNSHKYTRNSGEKENTQIRLSSYSSSVGHKWKQHLSSFMSLPPNRYSSEPTYDPEYLPANKKQSSISYEALSPPYSDQPESNSDNTCHEPTKRMRFYRRLKRPSSKRLLKDMFFSTKKQCDYNMNQHDVAEARMQVFSFRLSSMSVEQCRLHLVPPFAKKTNIHWDDQDMSGPLPCQQLVDHYQAFYPMMDDNERQPQPESHQVSRKRRCQPIMDPQQRKNLPLPPLPTVENFLTIMDEPNSPASSYFSARSHSSVSSNSTLNSLLLDDITDQLAKTHLIEPTFLFENNAILDKEQTADCLLSLPPPVPPKDAHLAKRKETKAIMQSISHYPHETSSHKKRRVTETTTNSGFFHKQSKQRPPIPPRRSSMPLPLPPKETEIPSMPLNAKKNAQYYRQKPSKPVFLDESSWSHFLGIQRKEHNETIKRAILGRSLGVPGLSKKVDKSDSKLLKMTEDGDVVLLYEIIQGKLQVVAGTPEKLFEKLADESVQDMNYVDTYLSNHRSFITSIDLLDQLISRFYLTPLPGEYEYFSKWQTSIQTKVLNVIHQWITIQYQDFKCNTELERKLHSFLCSSSLKKYSHQVEKIEEHMNQGRNTDAGFLPFDSIDNKETVLPMGTPQPTSRRPSNSLFNFSTLSSLPIQLMDSSFIHQDVQNYFITPLSSFVSLESKDIARYLTLADFYLFKSILVNGFMSDHLPKHPTEIDHVQLMTKRANMLGHWVVHEICSLTYLKPKRTLLRKFIEIAKLCFELNNFHTCMVITMGLASAPKLKETWESLSSRDTNTFASLQKLLDVTMNMRYYRQKTQQAKSPAIPFLPVVLKDYTFLNENSTFLNAYPNLINFTKFTLLKQFTDKTADLLNEPYWFSNKLTVYPFFDKKQSHGETGSLNSIADWIETRLSQVQDCYLQCDLL